MVTAQRKSKRRIPRVSWTLARRKVVWAYIFLAIPIVFFAYIRIYPALFAFQMSRHDYNPLAAEQPYVGLENYEQLVKDLGKRKSPTKAAFQNTANYLLLGVPIQLCLALMIALMLNEIRFMSTLYRIMFFLPFVTSTIAIAWVFRMLYQAAFWLGQCAAATGVFAAAALFEESGAGAAVGAVAGDLARHGIRRHHLSGWLEADPAHLLRSGRSRWREPLAHLPLYHAAAAEPDHRISAGLADDFLPADVRPRAGDDGTGAAAVPWIRPPRWCCASIGKPSPASIWVTPRR